MVGTQQNPIFHSIDLGIVEYRVALELQREFVASRKQNYISDLFLLLEHYPVITTGRFNGLEDIKLPVEELSQQGIPVVRTNRGGSATYHGPGQLVGYPVINLRDNRLGVREYIRKLEATIIRVLARWGISGHRIEPYPGGIWVADKKICSIGIHVTQQIAMHGFAINVCNDLSYFDYINPCGLQSDVMTSISKIMGKIANVSQLKTELVEDFSEEFGKQHRGEISINALR